MYGQQDVKPLRVLKKADRCSFLNIMNQNWNDDNKSRLQFWLQHLSWLVIISAGVHQMLVIIKKSSEIQTSCRCQKLELTQSACGFVLLPLVIVKKPSGALCLLLSYEPPSDKIIALGSLIWSLRGMLGSLLRVFTVCHKGLHTASGLSEPLNLDPLPLLISSHVNLTNNSWMFFIFPLAGVLLFGPPGCGKTMIAKATAKASGCKFINLQASTLTDMWYGESQKLTAAVFSLAVKIQPCIIFIDEIGELVWGVITLKIWNLIKQLNMNSVWDKKLTKYQII